MWFRLHLVAVLAACLAPAQAFPASEPLVDFTAVSYVYRNQVGESPEVQTLAGPVRGILTKTSRNGTLYEAFMGIPYGEPPVGPLRFKPPVPAAAWTETRDASTEGYSCVSLNHRVNVSEDCLNLNVFTPSSSPDSPRAVIVFIHGGGFLMGSSNTLQYGPDFLIDNDVLLVTFNYRIGPLGFLSLQNEQISGNHGLKDQALALRWVRDNIAAFGGDAGRVTVIGQSAGAASLSLQLLSPTSRGLFDRAIILSGSALVPWGFLPPERTLVHAQHLGKMLECPEGELYECLMAAPAQKINDRQLLSMTIEDLVTLNIFPYLPTVEPDVEGAFLTRHPKTMLEEGDFAKVPIITGTTSDESMMILSKLRQFDPLGLLTEILNKDLAMLAPTDLQLADQHILQRDYVSQALSEFYFGGKPVSLLTRDHLLDTITDTQYVNQVMEATRLLVEHSDQPVYNYKFRFDGKYASYKVETGVTDHAGVSHSDDLGYLLSTEELYEIYNHGDRGSREEVTLDRYTALWTNFAKYGDPVPVPSALLPEKWVPVARDTAHYYDIGDELTAGRCAECDRVRFWNDIYETVLGTRPFLE